MTVAAGVGGGGGGLLPPPLVSEARRAGVEAWQASGPPHLTGHRKV